MIIMLTHFSYLHKQKTVLLMHVIITYNVSSVCMYIYLQYVSDDKG